MAARLAATAAFQSQVQGRLWAVLALEIISKARILNFRTYRGISQNWLSGGGSTGAEVRNNVSQDWRDFSEWQ
jgi:hypothetical protein